MTSKWVIARKLGGEKFEFLHSDGWRPVIMGARTFQWPENALDAGYEASEGLLLVAIDMESGRRLEFNPALLRDRSGKKVEDEEGGGCRRSED